MMIKIICQKTYRGRSIFRSLQGAVVFIDIFGSVGTMYPISLTVFGRKFLRNLAVEARATFHDLNLFVRYIATVIFYIFYFLFSFAEFKSYFSFIAQPLLIYIVGTYFTHLPWYVVFICMFLPIKRVMPFYAICFLAMFMTW